MKISVLTTPTTANESTFEYFVPNMETRFSALTFLSTELRNTLVSNSCNNFNGTIYINDLDRDEITDLDELLKNCTA